MSAWASDQSAPVASRGTRARADEVAGRFAGSDETATVPLPEFWGGFRVRPDEVEFWQHRDDRLHDRLRYSRSGDGSWELERLQP